MNKTKDHYHMTSHNMHSWRLLRGGGGSWATTKTIVHLSTIQTTVLNRLFADATSSWVRYTMLIYMVQWPYSNLYIFSSLLLLHYFILNIQFYFKHFLFVPKFQYFLKVTTLSHTAYSIRPRSKCCK